MCMRWRATTKLGWAANRAGAIGCAAFHLRLKADCFAKSRLIGCHVSSAFAGWPAPQPALRAFAAPPRHENRLRGSRKRLRYAKAARKQRGTLSRLAVGIPIDNALQRFRDMPHRTYAGGCATPQPCQQSPTIPFRVFPCAAKAAFVSGARGSDGSRDATRRTWRDEVSSHGATRCIKVAQQPPRRRRLSWSRAAPNMP